MPVKRTYASLNRGGWLPERPWKRRKCPDVDSKGDIGCGLMLQTALFDDGDERCKKCSGKMGTSLSHEARRDHFREAQATLEQRAAENGVRVWTPEQCAELTRQWRAEGRLR